MSSPWQPFIVIGGIIVAAIVFVGVIMFALRKRMGPGWPNSLPPSDSGDSGHGHHHHHHHHHHGDGHHHSHHHDGGGHHGGDAGGGHGGDAGGGHGGH